MTIWVERFAPLIMLIATTLLGGAGVWLKLFFEHRATTQREVAGRLSAEPVAMQTLLNSQTTAMFAQYDRQLVALGERVVVLETNNERLRIERDAARDQRDEEEAGGDKVRRENERLLNEIADLRARVVRLEAQQGAAFAPLKEPL